jgi:hypothetical protein
MKNTKKLIIFLFVACFIISSSATAQKESDMRGTENLPVLKKESSIKSHRMYEDCFELSPGQIMKYSFEASKPLDFNIHYHGEDRIYYPVDKKKISQLSGTIDVDMQRYYSKEQIYFCLMWTNSHGMQVDVTFETSINEKTGN